MNSLRSNVRVQILNQKEPFCLSDIYLRMSMENINDKELVTQVLNELYSEGLIEYSKIGLPTQKNSGYAFCVVEPGKQKSLVGKYRKSNHKI